MNDTRSCVFCEIANGRQPASIVHEDETCIAFMDLYPVRPGHVLVIPRQHAVFLHELPTQTQRHLFTIGCRVLDAQRACGLPWDGANVMVNDGAASGQHVPHVHLHLIPRTRGDMLRAIASFLSRSGNVLGRVDRRERLQALAERLRPHMQEGGRSARRWTVRHRLKLLKAVPLDRIVALRLIEKLLQLLKGQRARQRITGADLSL
jgi:histidine triad (HIT) family protein